MKELTNVSFIEFFSGTHMTVDPVPPLRPVVMKWVYFAETSACVELKKTHWIKPLIPGAHLGLAGRCRLQHWVLKSGQESVWLLPCHPDGDTVEKGQVKWAFRIRRICKGKSSR